MVQEGSRRFDALELHRVGSMRFDVLEAPRTIA